MRNKLSAALPRRGQWSLLGVSKKEPRPDFFPDRLQWTGLLLYGREAHYERRKMPGEAANEGGKLPLELQGGR